MISSFFFMLMFSTPDLPCEFDTEVIGFLQGYVDPALEQDLLNGLLHFSPFDVNNASEFFRRYQISEALAAAIITNDNQHPALMLVAASMCLSRSCQQSPSLLIERAHDIVESTGDLDACSANWLGEYYLFLGLSADHERALSLFKEAADLGSTTAMVHLARIFRNSDENQAFSYASVAAFDGNADGAYELSRLYEYGIGTPVDLVRSFFWCEKAAWKGHADSQFYLTMKYLQGSGTPVSKLLADQWALIAAELGSKPAMEYLSEINVIVE